MRYKPTIVLAIQVISHMRIWNFYWKKKLMPIFLITSIKLKKKEKPGSSGTLFLNTMKKKTAIIALLHLKFPLQEYKRGKVNLIYDIMSVAIVLSVC
jgi:hypothetical protein